MGTDGHRTKQGGAILPDALRWLWRDYPAPIVVHEPAAAEQAGRDPLSSVFSTIYVDKPRQQVEGDYGVVTSLTSDSKGNVYFPSPEGIYRVDVGAHVARFADSPDPAATMRVRMGGDDRLYAYISKEVVCWSTAASQASDEKTVARNLPAVEDFAVTQKGAVYFIDRAVATVGLIDPAGQVRFALRPAAPDGGATAPKGLTLSPDQSMLVISDEVSRCSWSFQIAADGTLVNGEPFSRLELPETTTRTWASEVRGAVVDVNGEVFFATPLGIQVSMQNGRIMQILNPPDPSTPGAPLTAMTFAGANGNNWLYVAENGKLYRRPVKVTGANAWTVVKPPKPTL
ncbi:MAG: SMP-30/gluconolactonase/LRE family protein [Terracidiphilus sp.]